MTGGVVLLSSPAQPLLALDADTGRRRWENEELTAAIDRCAGTWIPDGDGLVGLADCSGDELVALDGNGEVRWHVEDAAPLTETLLTVDGMVVAAGPSFTARRLVGFDAASGRERWRIEEVGGVADAVVLGDRVVAAVEDENRAWLLQGLDPATGDIDWELDLADHVDAAEDLVFTTDGTRGYGVATDGTFVVVDAGGRLVDAGKLDGIDLETAFDLVVADEVLAVVGSGAGGLTVAVAG